MPRADSLTLRTGVRLSAVVLAPLASRISCALGPICDAARLCVEITFVRPFTASETASKLRTVKTAKQRRTLRPRHHNKLNAGVCTRKVRSLLQEKIARTLTSDALLAVLNDKLTARKCKCASPTPNRRLRRKRATEHLLHARHGNSWRRTGRSTSDRTDIFAIISFLRRRVCPDKKSILTTSSPSCRRPIPMRTSRYVHPNHPNARFGK